MILLITLKNNGFIPRLKTQYSLKRFDLIGYIQPGRLDLAKQKSPFFFKFYGNGKRFSSD